MYNKEGHASLLTDDSVETLQCCLHAEDGLQKGTMLLLNIMFGPVSHGDM